MAQEKRKFYVVWQGRQPGVYATWPDCQAQVSGFAGAVYKSFATKSEAEAAFAAPASEHVRLRPRGAQRAPRLSRSGGAGAEVPNPPSDRHDTVLPLPPEVKADAIAVDAACSGNPGQMEYRGIHLATGQEVFHYGPVRGTNNIGEFLAIVHALALIEQRGTPQMSIYSDSRNAMLWVKQKHCKTKLARTARTAEVFDMIERAERWLAGHRIVTPIIKWETRRWGEIPADFGRK